MSAVRGPLIVRQVFPVAHRLVSRLGLAISGSYHVIGQVISERNNQTLNP